MGSAGAPPLAPERARRDPLAHGRRDVGRPRLDGGRVVGRQDERPDPVLEGEPRQLLHPLRGGECAGHVQEPADRGRVAAGRRRRGVDGVVPRREIARLEVGERGQPAAGLAPCQVEHARLVGADPDADVVQRRRAAGGTVEAVVEPSTCAGPG